MKRKDIDTDLLVEKLSYVGHEDKKEMTRIGEEFGCSVSVSTEKHNSLQYTYYFECDFGETGVFYVEIESGIDNGTLVRNEEWDVSTQPTSRTARALKDVVLDKEWYISRGQTLALKKAEALLSANKQKFFDFERQNNYDNYVTGGNSKMKFDSLLSQLQVEYIYDEIEVDVNFI